jgi:two-component system, LytTR family, response regulator
MGKFTAIIIDDSQEFLMSLSKLLTDLFDEDVELLGTFNIASDGLKGIIKLEPQVVFLDIEMPELTGLELNKMIPSHLDTKVVIISGKEKYALEAIKDSVFDYILKPISIIEIKKSIDKLKMAITTKTKITENLKMSHKIMVNRHDKTLIIDMNDIKYLEADAACTIIHYEDKKVSSTKRFNYYEDLLPKTDFVKIHRSCLVNVHYIQEIIKQDGVGYLLLKDDTKLELSKSKKDELVNSLMAYVKK